MSYKSKMKVGMAQLLVEGAEPERNFGRAHKLIKQAVEKNATSCCCLKRLTLHGRIPTAIGHSLARMGAQILLSLASWTVDYSITEEDEPYHDQWIKPLGILSKLYDVVVISTTGVGYIVGGPYEGKKMVGCSLAVDKNGILKRGVFNEFAGVLEEAEFEIPLRKEKGTQIGEMLRRKGYRFD